MLLRLLFFVLLVFVLLSVIKSYLARSRGRSGRAPPDFDAEETAIDPQCQSYVPKREAIEAGGNFFCSWECAERYRADRRKLPTG
ncbi:MAG TPA: hypothetical protein VIH18_15225 [Candidatus Binatia bacterium]